MKTPTHRQQEVLDFVHAARQRHGVSPTLREIAAHFGFRSVKAAADHVTALRRKGALTGERRRARSLQVPSPPPAPHRTVVEVPIYGSIPAGFARNREQEVTGCISVDIESLGVRPTARTFALRVQGDSMIERHICPGDYVVLEHGQSPRNGDVVAALIDNESTLKTFVQEDGRPPHLKAENPKYPQLHPAAELVVQGVMVGLIRKCNR